MVVVVLALQLLLPLLALVHPGPTFARLGWQMYARDHTVLRIETVTDGKTARVDPAEIIPLPRPEVDYTPVLAHMCAVRPRVDLVRITRDEPPLHLVRRC